MITPETKSWTWILTRACPECGFDASQCPPEDVANLVRENSRIWEELLGAGVIRPGRPDGSTWSTLEYACHVRDVYQRFSTRIGLMLDEDDPMFPSWDQDESAVAGRYDEQDPVAVVGELVAAAQAVASQLDGLSEFDRARLGRRSDGASFSVGSISRYMVHDTIHHVADVERQRG